MCHAAPVCPRPGFGQRSQGRVPAGHLGPWLSAGAGTGHPEAGAAPRARGERSASLASPRKALQRCPSPGSLPHSSPQRSGPSPSLSPQRAPTVPCPRSPESRCRSRAHGPAPPARTHRPQAGAEPPPPRAVSWGTRSSAPPAANQRAAPARWARPRRARPIRARRGPRGRRCRRHGGLGSAPGAGPEGGREGEGETGRQRCVLGNGGGKAGFAAELRGLGAGRVCCSSGSPSGAPRHQCATRAHTRTSLSAEKELKNNNQPSGCFYC